MPEESTQTNLPEVALSIISTLSELPPYQSLSFYLNPAGIAAIKFTTELMEEKFPKNMTNLKPAAIDSLAQIAQHEEKTPINVNFNEDELKALEKVKEILEREV